MFPTRYGASRILKTGGRPRFSRFARSSKARLKPGDVKAIGLSGQMHGSVFLDKQNKVIRRAILWNDQRTSAECAEIERRAGGRAKLIKMVANPALTGFTAPKILWLRNHEPKHFDKTRKILLPKDEIRRRLTGQYATEVSDASGMLLLDVAKRKWSKELLSALELDIDLFGTCYESEEITGKLTPAAAKTLGLTTDCVVVGGAGDCAAGAVGNGIVNRGVLSTSIGTSGVVFVHSDELKIDPKGRVHTFCHAVRGKWHMMGVNLSAGGSLQWFRNELCKADIAAAKKAGRRSLRHLDRRGRKCPAGQPGAIFSTVSVRRTNAARRSLRPGLLYRPDLGPWPGAPDSGNHGRRNLFHARQSGYLRTPGRADQTDSRLRRQARSALWRQIQADVFGRKVVTINSEEGPAYGVALLAAVGAGTFKDIREACAAVIRVVSETSPDRDAKKHYDKAFPIYQQLYRSLKNDFKSIASLEK